MAAYTFPTVPATYVVGDTITFNYTNASQTFLTSNISRSRIEIWGAEGGSNSPAGTGGYTFGNYNSTSGTTLYVYVGGKGVNGAGGQTYNTQPAGAFNGGGQAPFASNAALTITAWGNGGGGATDVRLGGTTLSNRIIVAGGGGGGGDRNVQLTGYAGGGAGGGGGFMSFSGNPGYTACGRSPGSGATISAGGAGGIFNYDFGQPTGSNGDAGTLGVGGMGGEPAAARYDYAPTGGSGGGGYYGGGGGCCGGYDGRGGSGGGGGSGYINTTHIQSPYGGESGSRVGNGTAIITVLAI